MISFMRRCLLWAGILRPTVAEARAALLLSIADQMEQAEYDQEFRKKYHGYR